jgi:adenine-specific DNA methylase
MIWDFVEINPLRHSGGWTGAYEDIASTIENNDCLPYGGHAEQFSATEHGLADDIASALVTDPPYYDAIPYADLSDFFYVWLRPLIRELYPNLAQEDTTPKEHEAIWNPGRLLANGQPKNQFFYENQIQKALSEGRRITAPDGVCVVVFAHKSTAGWETLLSGMLQAGWIVVASWPIDTEREARTNAIGTASLASSVHLVCRPRKNTDGSVGTDNIGDWRVVLSELPRRIHEWMPRLAKEGVVGADAIFACLGPALEIFSRYSRVEKASGDVVTLKEFLEHVWAAVAREALTVIFAGADVTGFEEDARLTAMWLWTLSTGNNGSNGKTSIIDEETEGDDDEVSQKAKPLTGYVLEYDAARKIAQGLGVHLDKLNSLVEVKGETARLLPVAARATYLFGKDAGQEPAKRKKKDAQLSLFDFMDQEEQEGGSWQIETIVKIGHTVLDQLHQSMILFAAGRGEALKRFLVEEGIGRDQRFWRLAQAFSALYPSKSDEKRWVDGVLARKKGLGF